MDMLDMPVTLIVKAPNQQVEDQTIHCELNWTIRKLKGYLSEVYPSKPRTEDQKLIYSGQLLHDSVVLKDVLRRYEGQETHTVHLVCTPSRDSRYSSSVPTKTPSRMTEGHISPNSSRESLQGQEDAASSDGLRHRLTASQSPPTQPTTSRTANTQFQTPDPRAFWAGAMANPYASTPGLDPNSMPQQMAWMQQAYAHYITQYMHLSPQQRAWMQQVFGHFANQYLSVMASGAVPPAWYPPSHATVPVPAPQHNVTDTAQMPAANPQEQPAAQQNNNVNAADGAEEEDEGRGNRDWLDWFYTMSRVMVLFCIVYFYSSPTRFIIVSVLGCMLYLYQLGFFRAQQMQAAQLVGENNNEAVDARVAENNNHQNEGIGAAAAAAAGPRVGVGDRPAREEGSGAEAPEPEPDRPSLFALTWTFFTSFFASLIPEQPGAL